MIRQNTKKQVLEPVARTEKYIKRNYDIKCQKKRNKMFQNYKLNVTIIIGYKMKL